MNERIKILRESMELSRAAFGERLGISGDMVNNMERGRSEIREDRIKLICSTFRINEPWLRTGEGEMMAKLTKNQEILEFANDIMELPDQDIKKKLLLALSRLTSNDWKRLTEIASEVFQDQEKEKKEKGNNKEDS